ncbi:hypothetical protein LTR85_001903 [Meristemomyces frigidus]|nr:hypothetical protein LTR85_001903 [Meristemomyces frigidus]
MRPDGLASSRFGKLAPEIRNRIYELTLARPKPFLIGVNSVQKRLRQGRLKDDIRRDFRGLLLSCRVISAECAQLFYAANTFVFSGSNHKDSADTLEYFSNKIGQVNMAALRQLALNVDVIDTYAYGWGLDRYGFERTKTAKLVRKVQQQAETHSSCLFTIRAAFVDGGHSPVEVDIGVKGGVVLWEESLEKTDRFVAAAGRRKDWLRRELSELRSDLEKTED